MSHEELRVDLASGGSITLSIDIDVWSISDTDAAWVLSLVRTMRELAKVSGLAEAVTDHG